MPRSPKLSLRHMSHCPAAHAGTRHRIGPAHDPDDADRRGRSLIRWAPRAPRPGSRGRRSTFPRSGGGVPYDPSAISRSVPHTPTAKPRTRRCTVARVRVRDVLDAGGPFLPRYHGHRTHVADRRTCAAASASPDSGDYNRRRRLGSSTPMASSRPTCLDVVVIGAGPAGVVASLRAARLGARTALDHPR